MLLSFVLYIFILALFDSPISADTHLQMFTGVVSFYCSGNFYLLEWKTFLYRELIFWHLLVSTPSMCYELGLFFCMSGSVICESFFLGI
uniref:Putative secreted protein n=1 Tax=Ixodes ricinus TaxID=34613 RepID=A0A6B0U9Q3_IXORI